jgi:ankyrin repeat protein
MEVSMTAQPLPPRPSLDQLKRQAKDLLRLARQHSPTALARFRALPAYAAAPDAGIAAAKFALHDAQSVIAREHGFVSWNALRERVEELTLGFDAAVTEFIEAATSGRGDRAERLLALHPQIGRASFHAALVIGDAEFVMARLDEDAALATREGGPRGWRPLHYVCHTSVAASTDRDAGLAAITRRLLALGEDPNLRFPWRHHDVFRPVLWGAVSVVHSLGLARALLDGGANPSDGVTLTLAASAGNVPALSLLHEFGADLNGPWATDGSTALYAMLHWSQIDTGARWLIEHGADVDAVDPATGETPLHVVAARWTVPLAEALVDRGAQVNRRRKDGRTPYAVARLSGNDAVADWLLARGADDDVSAIDRLVGLCSRGDVQAARATVAAHPELPGQIGPEHYDTLYQAAERNDVNALEALLSCGFDPNRGDAAMDMNALHKAAMAGWPDAVRVLLAHGASVEARDREFHATALVAAAEGSRHAAPDRDHAAVGRLLLDAGSPLEWRGSGEPADEQIVEIIDGWKAT